MENRKIDPAFEFLQPNGKVAPKRIGEAFLQRARPDLYNEIMDYADKIGISHLPFNEKVYHRIFLFEKIICENCQKEIPNFLDFKRGYSRNCSSKCSNNSKPVQDNKKQASLERYGVDNPSKSQEVINGLRKTFEERYGGNPLTLNSIKEKIKKTNLERYGDESPMGSNSSLRKGISEQKEKEFIERYPELDIIEYESDKSGDCKIRCGKCQEVYTILKRSLQARVFKDKINPCTICNPIGSSLETGIEAFIEHILIKNEIPYKKKDRKFLENGKELDFLIPSKKIAIEADGIYWHCSDYRDKTYHNEKTERCMERGYRLLHVFEDEIVKTPEIVESRIKSILGIITKRIYARKCEIKEVSSQDASKFLKRNHLQGNASSRVRLGLFYNDELVSLMTFGQLRRSLGASHKEGHWEMVRFANELETNVIGGASKLLQHFIKKYFPIRIETFCDRRWSPDGMFYSKLGFEFIKDSGANYWWIMNNSYDRLHRFSFRKDVLVRQGFDPTKTEVEIMIERGFKRIYDCGSSKWVMNLIK